MKFTYWPITQLGNYERGLWLGSNWIKLYFCCFGKNGPCLQMFTIWPIKLLRKHSDCMGEIFLEFNCSRFG